MHTCTAFVISGLLLFGVAVNTQAQAVEDQATYQLESITNQHLLSAQTRLNGPQPPERGSGRRE